MSNALEIAHEYFDVSNRSDMEAISKLFTPTTTYSSQNTGVYAGVDQIIEMQTAFHGSFKSLNWEVLASEEVRPGVVWLDFVLSGEKLNGEKVHLPGIEYVVVIDGRIQHVEVRNK